MERRSDSAPGQHRSQGQSGFEAERPPWDSAAPGPNRGAKPAELARHRLPAHPRHRYDPSKREQTDRKRCADDGRDGFGVERDLARREPAPKRGSPGGHGGSCSGSPLRPAMFKPALLG